MSSSARRPPKPNGSTRRSARKALIASPLQPPAEHDERRDHAADAPSRSGSRGGRACSSGSSQTVPSASARPRSTPCHSGSSQAIDAAAARAAAVIGKNVPENRNSGVIPNRQIELNDDVSRWVDMYAAIGPANASAVRVPTGTVRTMPGVAAAPNSDDHEQKIAPTSVARVAIQASWPTAIAYGRERRRVHRVEAADPVEPGQDREGGLEHRALHHRGHEQRRRQPLEVRHAAQRLARRCRRPRTDPRPIPIATRNRTGWAKLPKIEPRQVRT